MRWTTQYRRYESEFEQFIDELKRQHPDIEGKQLEAHAMWWDKPPLELEEMARDRMSEVKPTAYAYS
jgi:hypothetical protein